MKREILFRGQTIDGIWCFGDLIHIGGVALIYHGDNQELETIPQEDSACAVGFSPNEISIVIPKTVGQFTGLTDKDGKRIFEGDLVSFEDDPIDEVVYDNTYSGFVFKTIEKSTDIDFYADWLCLREEHQKYYVIRGNVHDNSELI